MGPRMGSLPVDSSPQVDGLTLVSLSALAISLNVGIHEGIHALTCWASGGVLQAYSALYVSCATRTALQDKLVAGSAPLFNIAAGTALWLVVRRPRGKAMGGWYFLWLLMLMNWLYGAGYWMFSGIADVGDMAVVIRGWQPSWLWHVLMAVIGSLIFLFFVWLAVQEFGKRVGGEGEEQIRRANKLTITGYVTSLVVVLVAGLFSPAGFLSLPVTAGLLAVVGGLSPLLWMMQWFRAKMFEKPAGPPLEIVRNWSLVVAGLVVFVAYAVVLGRSLTF